MNLPGFEPGPARIVIKYAIAVPRLRMFWIVTFSFSFFITSRTIMGAAQQKCAFCAFHLDYFCAQDFFL